MENKKSEPIYIKDCIFGQISNGLSPCYKVWENDHHLAFLSIYPNTRGITVVIPKSHYGSYIFDQDPATITTLMSAAKEVSNILVTRFETVDRVGVVFEGYGVNHLHVKLFPLHGTRGPWRAIKSEMRIKYDTYPGYISTHDVARAPDEELDKLAQFLRNGL